MPHLYSELAARIRVPGAFLLAVIYLVLAQPTARGLLLGATVALAGLLLRAVSAGHVTKDQRLATTGPYAYTRNPLYLGSAVAGIGFCIAGGRWWFFLLLGIFLAGVYWPVIRREEAHLSRVFPEEYAAYVRAVPMLLPRFLRPRIREGTPARFDWRLYRKNREYQAFLAYVGIILFLLGKMLLTGKN